MTVVLTGWAKGRSRSGTEQAVRVQVKRPDYDVNEEYDAMREASALYRRTYHEWAAETGHASHGEGPDGITELELDRNARSRGVERNEDAQ